MSISQVTKATNSSDVAKIAQVANADGVQVQTKDSDVASQQPQNEKLENIAQVAEEKPISEEEAKEIERYQKFLRNFVFVDYDFENLDPDGKPKITPFDPELYKQEGDKLWEAVNDFIKKTGGPTANLEIFENAKKEFIGDGKSVNCLSMPNFVKWQGDNGKVIVAYRGTERPTDVESLRKGVFYAGAKNNSGFDANFKGNRYGSGLYASTSVDVAHEYAVKPKVERKEEVDLSWNHPEIGAVVTMGIDEKKAKIIDMAELLKIKRNMFYHHLKEFGKFYDIPAFGFFKGDIASLHEKSYHGKLYEQAFEKVFGFPFKKLAENINPDYENLNE